MKKKGEKVALIISQDIELADLKKAMLETGANPLMIPSDLKIVNEIPMLGSGKTDFKIAKDIFLKGD